MGEEMNWAVEFQKDGGAAMDRLLERYGPMMAYVVGGILSDPHEAEECLARVRAKLWEKAASFDGERAWPPGLPPCAATPPTTVCGLWNDRRDTAGSCPRTLPTPRRVRRRSCCAGSGFRLWKKP